MFTNTASDHRESEHDAASHSHLEAIRALSDDCTIPEGGPTSYRNVLVRLQLLEEDVDGHVHEENNVLFPDIEVLFASERPPNRLETRSTYVWSFIR